MKRNSAVSALVLALIAAIPAAAQNWSVQAQARAGGPWTDQTGPLSGQSEERARAGAERQCVDRGDGPNHAAKYVSPSGVETIILCSSRSAPARPPAAAIDVETEGLIKNCRFSPFTAIFVDCGCVAGAAKTMRPVAGGKKTVDRVAEACTADKAHIEQAFYAQCLPALKTTRPDAERVCRCMSADVAAKYRANPVFNQNYMEKLRGAALRACTIGAR